MGRTIPTSILAGFRRFSPPTSSDLSTGPFACDQPMSTIKSGGGLDRPPRQYWQLGSTRAGLPQLTNGPVRISKLKRLPTARCRRRRSDRHELQPCQPSNRRELTFHGGERDPSRYPKGGTTVVLKSPENIGHADLSRRDTSFTFKGGPTSPTGGNFQVWVQGPLETITRTVYEARFLFLRETGAEGQVRFMA